MLAVTEWKEYILNQKEVILNRSKLWILKFENSINMTDIYLWHLNLIKKFKLTDESIWFIWIYIVKF